MSQPKIVVVGLLPAQARRVERRCGSVARLRFVDVAREGRLPAGDHVVLVIKFIKRKWTTFALRDFPHGNVHYAGGLTEVERVVREIGAGVRHARACLSTKGAR